MDCLMSAQLEKLTKLLNFITNICKSEGETPWECWFELLSSDHPKEDVLSYHLIFYVLLTGLAPEYHLIKKLVPLVISKMHCWNLIC